MREIIPEEEGIIKYAEAEPKAPLLKQLFVPVLVILIGFLGFGLGRLSKIEEGRVPVTIEYPAGEDTPAEALNQGPDGVSTGKMGDTSKATTSPIVASKNGTKYYFTWCSGASRISTKNRVYFSTAAAAEARGLTKAANCPGL